MRDGKITLSEQPKSFKLTQTVPTMNGDRERVLILTENEAKSLRDDLLKTFPVTPVTVPTEFTVYRAPDQVNLTAAKTYKVKVGEPAPTGHQFYLRRTKAFTGNAGTDWLEYDARADRWRWTSCRYGSVSKSSSAWMKWDVVAQTNAHPNDLFTAVGPLSTRGYDAFDLPTR